MSQSSDFKIGDRFVIRSDTNYPKDFQGVRCEIRRFVNDPFAHIEFVPDSEILNWSYDYFNSNERDIKKHFTPEHIYDSPLYQALR